MKTPLIVFAVNRISEMPGPVGIAFLRSSMMLDFGLTTDTSLSDRDDPDISGWSLL